MGSGALPSRRRPARCRLSAQLARARADRLSPGPRGRFILGPGADDPPAPIRAGRNSSPASVNLPRSLSSRRSATWEWGSTKPPGRSRGKAQGAQGWEGPAAAGGRKT